MVKNVTLTLEESLLEKARSKATIQHKSLNELFREWVRQYVGACRGRLEVYRALMKKLNHVRAGRHFSREEMNER
jgi:hypothetical protein